MTADGILHCALLGAGGYDFEVTPWLKEKGQAIVGTEDEH